MTLLCSHFGATVLRWSFENMIVLGNYGLLMFALSDLNVYFEISISFKFCEQNLIM